MTLTRDSAEHLSDTPIDATKKCEERDVAGWSGQLHRQKDPRGIHPEPAPPAIHVEDVQQDRPRP